MEHSLITIYYGQHPTKTMLFANKFALDNFKQYATDYYERDSLNGCVVTKNTGYVDLEIENTDYSKIRKAGWIWVYNYDNNIDQIDNYYGFISDIQLNNFTEDKNILYVRVTFVIDWWHTLLESGDLDQSKLYGQVNRAHVNDLVRREDDKVYPTLKYTFDSPEELVIRNKRVSYEGIVPKDNDLGEVYYLYIVVRHTPRDFITQDFPVSGDKTFPTTPQALVCVLPVYDRAFISGVFAVQGVSETQAGNIFIFDDKVLNINNLSDDDIISMFISSVPPVPYTAVVADGTNITFVNTPNYIVIELDYRNSDGTVGKLKAPCFSTYTYHNFKVDSFISSLSSKHLVNDFWGDGDIYQPFYKDSVISFSAENSTYEYYLSTIAKYRSHAYSPIYLTLNEDILYQTIYYDKNAVVMIQNVTTLGGLVYTFPTTEYFIGDERIDYDISTPRVYTPLVYLTSEQLDKANLEVAKGVGDIFNAVASLATGGGAVGDFGTRVGNWNTALELSSMKGGSTSGLMLAEPLGGSALGMAVKGIAGAYNSAISAVGRFQDAKIMRKGKVGKSSNQPFASQVPDSFFSVICETPEDSERDIILEHLAMYGYNTFLDLHDILLNHKRTYFNYIQTIDCMYNEPSLREDIRVYIQNMFNNGVWLWHSAVNFGKFNIPNWQTNM